MTACPPEAQHGPRLSARIAAALRPGDTPALHDGRRSVALNKLASRSFVERLDALAGRTVLIRTRAPLAAALALASLDGVAARLVLCPPDIEGGRLAQAGAIAGAEAIASDTPEPPPHDLPLHPIAFDASSDAGPLPPDRWGVTEWALFTSGTSGAPKMVVHDLDRLTGAITPVSAAGPVVWATFYDIRRYGGLQMLLRALTGGFGLHLADPEEPPPDFLARLGRAGVTHLAGTP